MKSKPGHLILMACLYNPTVFSYFDGGRSWGFVKISIIIIFGTSSTIKTNRAHMYITYLIANLLELISGRIYHMARIVLRPRP